jgi:hypothetical protein
MFWRIAAPMNGMIAGDRWVLPKGYDGGISAKRGNASVPQTSREYRSCCHKDMVNIAMDC